MNSPDGSPLFDRIDKLFDAQQKHRAAVASTTAAQRIAKLRKLEKAMFDRRDEIRAAMWEDFRKPPAEVDLGEIYPVVSETRHARRHLRSWMRPRRVGTRLALTGSSSRIVYEPRGVALIIAPWNFPFNLVLAPLVSAIAAGNCAILKPSELTPASAACMERMIAELFPPEEVAIVLGGPDVATYLLGKRFDHIFFTGSPAVGRIVMKAAAEHLTPVTLELGGKTPVIVDATAGVRDAAKKVAWGKFFNCGQICIAPDYVLVDQKVRDEFLRALADETDALGGAPSRGIIVNDRHASRVRELLDDALAHGAKLVAGGTGSGRELAPTILTDVDPESKVMSEEIFGPLLPVLSYRTLDEALGIVRAREKPLTMYVFTRDRNIAQRIVRETSAGSTAINHTMIQFYETDLPFGGSGFSGIGRSHGFAGFEAFSNARGVLKQWFPLSAIQLVFPPYQGRLKKFFVDFTVRWL